MEYMLIILSILIFIETTLILFRLKFKDLFKSNEKRKVYIDTSALIDGRIVAVAKTGFLGDEFIIPRSVIRELQLLADSKDGEKRTRARIGLDNVNEFERVVHFNTTILQDPLDRTLVDDRLIELAKQNKGLILTNDFNLGKVAATEKVTVLNINDLSLALRGKYQVGDQVAVRISSAGNGEKQGVGNLEDGTMIVVDNASNKIGKDLEVKIIRSHQTPSGNIFFANIVKPRSIINKNPKLAK